MCKTLAIKQSGLLGVVILSFCFCRGSFPMPFHKVCKNWATKEILLRVGIRPIATIVHAQFHIFVFASIVNAKHSIKICTS